MFGNDYKFHQKINLIMKNIFFHVILIIFLNSPLLSQTDTTLQIEEDYSLYDNLQFADKAAKNFCSNKIEGLSPSKLISFGYDFQGPQKLIADTFLGNKSYEKNFNSVHGMRLSANVPVVSRNNLILQFNGNYMETIYENTQTNINSSELLSKAISNYGLRSLGLGTTIFKPIDDKKFLLFQGSADLNGDWKWDNLLPLNYLKYSAAFLYGVRKNDRKQWGIGLSRTYRAGELNYIPVFLFNSTSVSNKWGTEILFPARVHVRRTFNARSMAFFGYELEGQSYRLWNTPSFRSRDLEIRRSELRIRLIYERSLKGFIWISIQGGYRINYSYNVDAIPNGNDFYRGFFGEQPFVMQNKLTNPFYFNVSINLVSP